MTDNDLSEPLLGAEAGRAERCSRPRKKRWPILRTNRQSHTLVAAWQLGLAAALPA